MGDLAACDIVIESIVEQDEAKRKVFNDLKAVLRADAILASNTSSIRSRAWRQRPIAPTNSSGFTS